MEDVDDAESINKKRTRNVLEPATREEKETKEMKETKEVKEGNKKSKKKKELNQEEERGFVAVFANAFPNYRCYTARANHTQCFR